MNEKTTMWLTDRRYQPSTNDISRLVLPDGRGHIFISNYHTAREKHHLVNNNIKGIISIGDDEADQVKHHQVNGDARVLPITVPDELESKIDVCFAQTREFINEILASGGSVLVHCWGGISRSPTIVIAYLMNEFGMSLQDALDAVRTARRKIKPNMAFQTQLMAIKRCT